MCIRKTIAAPPEGWELTRQDAESGHARYVADDGRVELSYYTLLPGVLLTGIDLACSVLPASFPLSPQLATINRCALGRCEVDFGDRGSLVVREGELCLSSAFAASFSYPTGAYRGFELFVDLDGIKDAGWELLCAFGLSRSVLAASLCPPDLGVNLVPAGQLADAVEAIETELSLERPRNSWLLTKVLELLMVLGETDLQALPTTDAYLLRSQRDMAQAVYQLIVERSVLSVDLAPLALRFGVSESSLRGYFARVYGQSPASFARSRSLAYAARLLRESDRSISDVGRACGYANPSKFSAAFRRAYDINPLEYRRRSRLL